MTVASYVCGVIALGTFTAAVAVVAVSTRSVALPRAVGASARLVEAVVGLAVIVVISELLGSVGALHRWPLVISALVAAALSRLAVRHIGRPARPPAFVDGSSRTIAVTAALVVAIVVGQWAAWSVFGLRSGPSAIDTLRYHLPLAARFVQSGRVTALHFLGQDLIPTYAPLNSELVHTAAIALLGRDALSPLINLCWLALALVAGWSAGQLYPAVRLQLLTAVAATLSGPLIAAADGGAATNDVAVIALLVASVVCLLQWRLACREPQPVWLTISGLAGGLAIGTKLNAVVPCLAILAIVPCLARSGRARALVTWMLPAFFTGSFWYARNWIAVGSPLPQLRFDFGPLHLAHVADPVLRATGYSVAHYALQLGFWTHTVPAGLATAFGPLWWLLLATALVGVVMGLCRGPTSARVVATVAVAVGVAYAFTPYTAGGPEGNPWLFITDLRYLLPALTFGLMGIALVCTRYPRGRITSQLILVSLLIVGSLAHSGPYRALPAHDKAAGAALGVIAGVRMFYSQFRQGRRMQLAGRRKARSVALVAAAGLLLAGGYFGERRYLADRYASIPIAIWARNLHDARIGEIDYPWAYPLYGNDLSNSVVYLQRPDGNGGLVPPTTCVEWAHTLQLAGVKYVVVGSSTFLSRGTHGLPWTNAIARTRVVFHDPTATVLRLDGPLNPGACSTARS